MNSLQILEQHRNALLLAEAIGWLHDYRKCSDEHLKVQAANLSGQQALPRNRLANQHNCLTGVNLQLTLPYQSPRTAAGDRMHLRRSKRTVRGGTAGGCAVAKGVAA